MIKKIAGKIKNRFLKDIRTINEMHYASRTEKRMLYAYAMLDSVLTTATYAITAIVIMLCMILIISCIYSLYAQTV